MNQMTDIQSVTNLQWRQTFRALLSVEQLNSRALQFVFAQLISTAPTVSRRGRASAKKAAARRRRENRFMRHAHPDRHARLARHFSTKLGQMRSLVGTFGIKNIVRLTHNSSNLRRPCVPSSNAGRRRPHAIVTPDRAHIWPLLQNAHAAHRTFSHTDSADVE